MTIEPSEETDLLRWWHQYQARLLNQAADRIRNDMLQEVFAARRHLELACQSYPDGDTFGCQHHLAALERIHGRLKEVSDRLDSPYLQESLPLALQHAVEPWQDKFPLTLDLSPTWEAEPVEHTRLLILLVEALLAQLAAGMQPETCHISLKQIPKELSCRVTYGEGRTPETDELAALVMPFLKTFRLFTQGNYDHSLQPRSLSWVLRWPT